MLFRVAFSRTDVSEERIASSITVTRIGELGTTLAVTSNRQCPSVVSTAIRVTAHRFSSPLWRKRNAPPKRRFSQEPHDITSQKMAFLLLKNGSHFKMWLLYLNFIARIRRMNFHVEAGFRLVQASPYKNLSVKWRKRLSVTRCLSSARFRSTSRQSWINKFHVGFIKSCSQQRLFLDLLNLYFLHRKFHSSHILITS
jgi:hypothetical protein